MTIMYHPCGAAIQLEAQMIDGRLVDVFKDAMAETVDKPVVTKCPVCGKVLWLADLRTPSEWVEILEAGVNVQTAWAGMRRAA